MNELRKHYFLDRWVVVSSERANRPEQIEETHIQQKSCPFDRKNLKSPIFHKVGDPWEIAVIPNKFPAVDPQVSLSNRTGFLQSKGGFGMHEVVIDHPEHIKFQDFSDKHVTNLMGVYAQRTKAHMSDKRIEYVSVFRNEGAAAGASIAHPHSQILALPIVPRMIERERGKQDEYIHMFGENPFDKIYREEKRSPRFLFENSNFFAIAPFASVFPGETWIIAKRHVRTLFELTRDELSDFALALKKSIATLTRVFPGVSYNWGIHQAPRGRDFRLHLEIYPRLTKFAGFELSNDIYINTVPPESYAKEFREAVK
ncbi:MAG: galactose-1-phosphate uridylyltransferase [Candidatus Altiarchaeota archaeon]|nr:galactose-1-phosphate uridylyltransferase [Candidatus Altiarchaeota archaeon]